MPNEELIDETERLIAIACERLRISSHALVESALSLARTARSLRPSRHGHDPDPDSVWAEETPYEPDLTGRFAAYRG